VRFAKINAYYYYTMEDWEKDGKIKYAKRLNKDGSILDTLYYQVAVRNTLRYCFRDYFYYPQYKKMSN
jgi:hypothetical protein